MTWQHFFRCNSWSALCFSLATQQQPTLQAHRCGYIEKSNKHNAKLKMPSSNKLCSCSASFACMHCQPGFASKDCSGSKLASLGTFDARTRTLLRNVDRRRKQGARQLAWTGSLEGTRAQVPHVVLLRLAASCMIVMNADYTAVQRANSTN